MMGKHLLGLWQSPKASVVHSGGLFGLGIAIEKTGVCPAHWGQVSTIDYGIPFG
jgi:hypothetical protein